MKPLQQLKSVKCFQSFAWCPCLQGWTVDWVGHWPIMKRTYGSNAPCFFLKKCNYNYLHISLVHCVQSWDYFFTKSPLLAHFHHLHYQHIFSTFAWGVVHWSCKTLCWSVGAVHARCVVACRHPQNCLQSASFRRSKRWKSEFVKLEL